MDFLSKLNGVLFLITLFHPAYGAEKWPEKIESEEIILLRITEKSSPSTVKIIADSFGRKPHEVQQLLADEQLILWTINHQEMIKGFIYLDRYKSLSDLKEQVTDQEIAEKLFGVGPLFELSYNVREPFREQGLAGKALKAWTQKNKSMDWYPNIFAVVQEANKPSVILLEKYANFNKVAVYFYYLIEGPIFIYRPY